MAREAPPTPKLTPPLPPQVMFAISVPLQDWLRSAPVLDSGKLLMHMITVCSRQQHPPAASCLTATPPPTGAALAGLDGAFGCVWCNVRLLFLRLRPPAHHRALPHPARLAHVGCAAHSASKFPPRPHCTRSIVVSFGRTVAEHHRPRRRLCGISAQLAPHPHRCGQRGSVARAAHPPATCLTTRCICDGGHRVLHEDALIHRHQPGARQATCESKCGQGALCSALGHR